MEELGNIGEFKVADYVPDGETALYDAVTSAKAEAGMKTLIASGKSNTKKFFVDLSQVQDEDVDALKEIKVKFLIVTKECAIKPFVESKLGTYDKGKAYYALTKPEKVQGSKEIIYVE